MGWNHQPASLRRLNWPKCLVVYLGFSDPRIYVSVRMIRHTDDVWKVKVKISSVDPVAGM